MIFEPIPSPTPKVLREFGLTVGSLLALLVGLVFPWLGDRTILIWPFWIGGICIILGLVAPRSLIWIYYGWMRFGQLFAWINNAIMLSLVYYVVLTPMGVVMRSLMGYDPMVRHPSNQTTFRQPSTHRPPTSMEKPF